MRIVHITQYFHPEKGYQENQFAKHHKKSGNDVYLITSSYNKIWGTFSIEEINKLDNEFFDKTGVKVIRLKTFPARFSNRVFTFNLKRTLTSLSPDFVYVHSISAPHTIIAAKWLKKERKRKKIRAVVDDHMVFVASENPLSNLFYRLYCSLFFDLLKTAFDKCIAVSDETRDFLLSKFGAKIEPLLEIIPLGVDLKVFRFNELARKDYRKQLDISETCKLIVYTGKRDKFKNPIILAKVLVRLLKTSKDYKLVFIGENVNSYDSCINKIIVEHKLQSKILLLPPVKNEDLVKVYSGADFAVWPNGSSMSMLEAMACKCIVIAPKMKVNYERLGDGRGILFNAGSEESLFDSINNLEESKDQIAMAYSWVLQNDWEILAEKSINW